MPKLFIIALICISALVALGPSAFPAGSAKTGRTTITDEEVATARENIARYKWAQDIVAGYRKDALRHWNDVGKSAEDLLDVPDEQLWNLMPDTRIHREYYVNQHKGCPVHGIEIKKFGVFHPWKFDPFNKPFKIQCPVGGEWYPSNDFANGDLTSGDFPDDGTGFKKDGDTYYFIGEYIHAIYLGAVRPALDRLSQLYLLTGDKRYAHKAAVILMRIAEQFPNSSDKADRCYGGSWAFRKGLITDCIWSCGDVAGIAAAYDLIWDSLDEPETVAFVSKKMPEIKTGDDMRFYVEENIIRVGAKALFEKVVLGNFGMHQNTAATFALVLDDVKGVNKPDSLDLVNWLYYECDGPLRTFARNSLFKDGGGAESIGYNTSKLGMLPTMEKVEQLRRRHPDQIDTARYPILWDEPKLKAMVSSYFMDLILLDRYYPGIGDCGGPEPLHPTDRPRGLRSLLYGHNEAIFRQYGDERVATTLMDSNGNIAHSSIYDKPIDDKVRKAVKKLGAFLPRKTQLFDGYRLAIARSGVEEDQKALWVFYGAHPFHLHHDPMNFGLEALGKALTPDLGYPKSWTFAGTWEAHIATHNTVMIDQKDPTIHDFGRLVALQSANGVEMIDALEDPYRTEEQAFGEGGDRLYRRTSLLIDLSPQDCYVADIFRVRGGSEHWLSWHGPAVEPVYEGPALVRQEKGTLAGEDVEYNTERPGPDGKPLLDYKAMFTNVRRGPIATPWSLDYDCNGERKVHVRITGLPEPGTELVLADGRPPSQPDDYTITYSFACRKSDTPLTSQYLTVVEPYSEKRLIDSIERLEPQGKAIDGYRPAGIRVTTGEVEDTILSTGRPDGSAKVDTVSLLGDTGLVRRSGDRIERLFLSSGTRLMADDASIGLARAEIVGQIVALDRDANEITVAMEISDPKALIGRRIRIESADRGDAYEIVGAESAGADQVRLTLGTTSLLGEGVALGFEDGVIRNKTMLDFAGLILADGKWRQNYSLYRGAVVENEAGISAGRVLGSRYRIEPYADRYNVVLAEGSKRTADELKSIFTDADGDGRATFRLYEYGIGDRVVVPGLATLYASGHGYILEATDDVALSLPGSRLLMREAGTSKWIEIGRSRTGSVSTSIPLARFGGRAELQVD